MDSISPTPRKVRYSYMLTLYLDTSTLIRRPASPQPYKAAKRDAQPRLTPYSLHPTPQSSAVRCDKRSLAYHVVLAAIPNPLTEGSYPTENYLDSPLWTPVLAVARLLFSLPKSPCCGADSHHGSTVSLSPRRVSAGLVASRNGQSRVASPLLPSSTWTNLISQYLSRA